MPKTFLVRTKVVIGLVILGLAVALGYAWGNRPRAPLELPPTATPSPLLEVETIEVTARQIKSEVLAVGNLTTDPDCEARIGSPIAGRVSQLHRSVGERVEGGAPLATITSPEITKLVADHHHAELRLAQAEASYAQSVQAIRLGDEIRRPLEESRTEEVTSQTELAVRRSALGLSQRNLKRVEELFRLGVVSGRELEVARAEHAQALSQERQARDLAQLAREHRSREQTIAGQGAAVGPKLTQLETELKLAREEVRHLDVILRNLGLDPEAGGTGLVLRSPRNGTVVDRQVSLGQAVNAQQELFRVVDTSRLWLWIFLPEDDLANVHLHSVAQLQVGRRAGPSLSGRVSYLAPMLDPETRTLKALIVVENREGKLKAGTFVQAVFPVGKSRAALFVPPEAVVVEGTRSVVFRRKGNTFERTQVEVGDQHDGSLEVRQGLKAGDVVARRGQQILEQWRR